jgi:hypothetical protein
MALNERRNGQKWISREKRERLDLSASVEETLEDPVEGEVSWGEELDEQSSFVQPLQGKGIFPPRLSLQSRPVPALHVDNSVETHLRSYAVVPVEQESETATVAQNANILKRFAQRLTSSFAALGGVKHEVVESSVQFPQEQVAPSTTLLEPSIVDESAQRTSVPAGESLLEERIYPQLPVPAAVEELHTRQSQQRLAGRTTRIRLETPPVAVTMRSYQPGIARVEKAQSDQTGESNPCGMDEPASPIKANVADVVGGLRSGTVGEVERVSSPTPSPEILQNPSIVGQHSPNLPAVDLHFNRKTNTATHISGSGVFELGQGEAIVVNRQVTEASVVLVTLTANPGPVVVHYVTLRPRIGFTIHLTAPTTMRASFNYVVLEIASDLLL